jgi:hypothetical protein
MLHITCDLCGKEVESNEDHYIVKIEVFAAHDPAGLTEADLDEDHMEALSEQLREVEAVNDPDEMDPPSRQFRYDLCPHCRKKYLQAPLAKEAAASKLHFSEN